MDLNVNEKFIVDLIFDKKNIEIKNIDLEKIIKIGSSHLILPLIYSKIKNKKLIKLLPQDFVKYIKEIYQINLTRNKLLIEELNFISKIFTKNNIEHVFIKGSALLIKNYYKDIGERMIGDIDVLISEKDYIKSIKLIKENGYYNLKQESIYESIHYPRLVSNSKLFALEIHHKLLKKNKNFKKINISEYIELSEKSNNFNIPSKKNLLKHLIYNFQINDNGTFKCIYNYRTFYDVFLLCDEEINKHERNSKHIRRFFILLNMFILTKKNNVSLFDYLFIARFNLKYKYKLIRKIDNFISGELIKLLIRLNKLKFILKRRKS